MKRPLLVCLVLAFLGGCGDGHGPSSRRHQMEQRKVEATEVGPTNVPPGAGNEQQGREADPSEASTAGRTEIVPAGMEFSCTPTAVWDGDGPIWCAEGPKIRLAGIAAREIDEGCRTGHPCPEASGEQARDQLVDLLGGPKGELPTGHIRVDAPTMNCLSEGSARGSRTAAWCQTPAGVDLSCAMVGSGAALRWERYDPDDRCRSRLSSLRPNRS